MILISVKSNFMDVKHQEETDKGAEKYLLKVKKLHDTWRATEMRKFEATKPMVSKFKSRVSYYSAMEGWRESIPPMPCKIEIINTEQNQLNFANKLK